MANPELQRDIEDFIGSVLKRKYGVTVDEVHGMFDSDAAMERFADRLEILPAPREERGQGQPSHAQFIQHLRDSLKWQIARRLGNLPNAAASRIDDAGEADLRRWLDRMANAASVDAVLAGWSSVEAARPAGQRFLT